MFNADIDSLLHVSVADFLVNDDSDGGSCHIIDDAGLAVVDLEWHLFRQISVSVSVFVWIHEVRWY